MQHEAEAARFLDGEHLMAFGHELADVLDEFRTGERERNWWRCLGEKVPISIPNGNAAGNHPAFNSQPA